MNDNDSSLGSSPAERLLSKQEAAGSVPARGSIPEVWLYVVVRKGLSPEASAAQIAHASSEAASEWSLYRRTGRSMGSFPLEAIDHLPKSTRACILGATKEELAKLRYDLGEAGVLYEAILETDGPLEGVLTALGLVTLDRDELKVQVPLLAQLRPWRAK